ncbi:hypothetical protein Scep_006457 [Stephania cephalantha]|uniref:SET domain-containing protein n=1 Tax=Stephania cephalantha TaxID=152367 RepID=A0AAP0PN02_9MAGN
MFIKISPQRKQFQNLIKAPMEDESKLQSFLQWLHANGVELRGCNIKRCGPGRGHGLFHSQNRSDGILLVVPLDLAITPMRVLQDPCLGPKCRAMFDEGEVDDRFLMILFLTLERVRKNSSWKPYLDMLPNTFGNPLWFTDDELLELKGTSLFRKLNCRRKSCFLSYSFERKLLLQKMTACHFNFSDYGCEEMYFLDCFVMANSIFWTRALNIPFPHSYVFPQMPKEDETSHSSLFGDSSALRSINSSGAQSFVKGEEGVRCFEIDNGTEPTSSTQGETIWVEGLVPGIDFCNHDLKAAATWEVDGTGLTTGIPASMYLLSAAQSSFQLEKEILISYGNKGNEELLYLYGFVIDNNPDDYLMVHYPVEAIQTVPFADSKLQLIKAQKAEMRCLLPRSLLDSGFFPSSPCHEEENKLNNGRACNYSWSGQRKMPSYLNKLIFPEEFLTALRTIAMKEEDLSVVSSLLHELVGSKEERQRQPSCSEVRAAVWEASGDSGALQLLVDLLQMKMMELEEGTGTEASDSELLEKAQVAYTIEECKRQTEGTVAEKLMSRNKRSSIIYRRGQKQLTRHFLKEAEHALHLCLNEQS